MPRIKAQPPGESRAERRLNGWPSRATLNPRTMPVATRGSFRLSVERGESAATSMPAFALTVFAG
ncbi:MAG: hypothetical protein ACREH8_14325, partial [Opitutaceae bacterium]